MTKNDIIRMAQEAGLQPYYDAQEPAIEAFANLVAAAERAECAKLADKQLKNTAALMSNPPKSSAAWEIAIAIRARGTT